MFEHKNQTGTWKMVYASSANYLDYSLLNKIWMKKIFRVYRLKGRFAKLNSH